MKFIIIFLTIFKLLNSTKIKINGAKFIVKKLESYGITNIFGYTGGCNLKLFDELYSSPIKIFSNRNEQCCGFSAEAYAKVKGKTGIFITTSGPGLTNAITPIQDALSDGIPLLLISGQVASNKLKTSAFQECDAIKITKACVKKNILIKNIDSLVINFDKYFLETQKNRKGPVHMDICSNVFNEEIFIDDGELLPIIKKSNEIKFHKEKLKIIKTIHNKIISSKKPIFLIGQGVASEYQLFRDFIFKYKIPVCSTLHGLGIMDDSNKYFIGFMGMHGSYRANMAIQNADLIIGLGNRFDDRTVGNINFYGINARNNYGIIHIDNSKQKINEVKKNINPNISLHLDSKKFLSEIINIHQNKENKKYTLFTKFNKFNFIPKKNMLSIPLIIHKLSEKLNQNNINYIITTGVGVHQMQVAKYFKFNKPNSLITSGSQGTMGVGLPFAIGCSIAKPNYTVICIDGDGSFQMTSSDLMTLKEYNINVKIIIMDNSKLQMVHYWQTIFYNSNYASSIIKNPNFIKLAQSYDIDADYCDNINKLDYMIDKIINNNSSFLAHFKVSDVDCLPFIPPKNSLDNMILL